MAVPCPPEGFARTSRLRWSLPRRGVLAAVVGSALLWPAVAHAYIGPGAGFAFAGSVLVLLVTFALAFLILLTWPARWLWRLLRVGRPYAKAQVKRVVVLGLDGLDPGLSYRLLQQGKLPHLAALAERGVFRPLATTTPSMSPVAWSTFATGVDASRHRIFDFLTRDPRSYAPVLSSTEVGPTKRTLRLGRYVLPLGRPTLRLLQKSRPFWHDLGKRGIFSIIQRVPITFPAMPFDNGLLLSGMCVPDLRGSQGTFSYFTTAEPQPGAAYTGGERTLLRRDGQRIRSRIVGPDHMLLASGGRMTLAFTLVVADDHESAELTIDGQPALTLKLRQYSPWQVLEFDAGLGVRVRGIARFYLLSLSPEVALYLTPIQIDPEKPAMPISYPEVYSIYLSRKQGPFATLGLAEDTWALNERVLDERAFYEQCGLYFEERRRMFLDALAQTRRGVLTTVFDTTDRVQHMFYRYLDPTHPANRGKDTEELEEFKDAIERTYIAADALVGEAMARLDDRTVFMVVSDHGFTNFRRGVNLNTWLFEHGYLVLKDGAKTSGEYFAGVDWQKTQAFSLGLSGLFINRRGRERSGVVPAGPEYRALVDELCHKLEGLQDPATGQRCIRSAVAAVEAYDGPYRLDAPDVLVGYDGGYRQSWEARSDG
jgi:predicted AlkP superfamily phosphohydrolase/phosphomutase